jgi:U3 small nucleolar RNA-associated protein 21
MVYAFKSFNSPITCFTQTPVVDVIAIGLLDGSIVIHNIRTDATIMTLRQEGKVTAVTFRTGTGSIIFIFGAKERIVRSLVSTKG